MQDTHALGTIYLFPVPLAVGDASEVLPRRTLQLMLQIRHWVVEDVRTARRWLKACHRDIDINALTFTELNEHTPPEEVPLMLAPVAEGHDVGVMSEAGCPCVADPGSLLVAAAQARGYRVVPLVGPSSILMSLMASGFNGQSWAFVGYLPTEPRERQRRLDRMVQAIRRDDQTQIFIETPYRNERLIAELARQLPSDMHLCVACDITGHDENIRTLSIAQWRQADTTAYHKRPTIYLLYR